MRNKLYTKDPYEGFDPQAEYLNGWGSDDPNFAAVLHDVRPKLIVEVGSWLGASAIHMAKLAPEAQIVCVDTWLGSREFWLDHEDETRYAALNLHYGYPSVYYQFLSNVLHAGVHDQITPFPATSLIAARLVKEWGFTPDVVYLDGSHDYADVLADLEAWWPLVHKGGVLFGDDWHVWADVNHAVETFVHEHHLFPADVRGRQWVLQK